jgi:hypothetical protein
MTMIVGTCEVCGLPILGHEGQKRRTHHTTKDICIEILIARVEKLEAVVKHLKGELQASNESLRMFTTLPASIVGGTEVPHGENED